MKQLVAILAVWVLQHHRQSLQPRKRTCIGVVLSSPGNSRQTTNGVVSLYSRITVRVLVPPPVASVVPVSVER